MGLPASEKKITPLPPIKWIESPNQSSRVHGNSAVDLIIVHSPEGGYSSTINWLRNPASDVSYHVLIKEDGSEATQLVRFSRKAWHAGVHNSRSEGISLADYASKIRAFSPGGRKLARVVAFRLRKRGLKPIWRRKGEVGGGFCRHADIQSDRRDPMSLSRWLAFVAMVKWQYHRDGFRKNWGKE
jgi:hypothetical protein